MPEITTLKVETNQVKQGDRINRPAAENIVSGKTNLGGVVESMKQGPTNTVFETNRGRVVLRSGAEVEVQREVPTAEEAAAAEAAKETQRELFRRQMLLDSAFKSFRAVDALKAKIVAKMSSTWRLGEDITNMGVDMAAAEETAHWWSLVLMNTGRDGMTITEAHAKVKEAAAQQVLERGADDGWSGNGARNSVARAQHEVKREFALGRWVY